MLLSVILPHLGSSSTSPVSTFICSPAQQILRLVPARNSRRTRWTQPGLPRGHETIKESHPTFSSTVRASEDPGATPLAVAAPWAFARCRSRVGVGWPWGLLRGQGPATCQAEPQVREFWRWSGHRPGNPPGLCSQLPPWGGAGGFPSAGRGSGRAGPSRPEPRARSRRSWAPGSRQEVFRRSGRGRQAGPARQRGAGPGWQRGGRETAAVHCGTRAMGEDAGPRPSGMGEAARASFSHPATWDR